jgi:hypothetical protein
MQRRILAACLPQSEIIITELPNWVLTDFVKMIEDLLPSLHKIVNEYILHCILKTQHRLQIQKIPNQTNTISRITQFLLITAGITDVPHVSDYRDCKHTNPTKHTFKSLHKPTRPQSHPIPHQLGLPWK